MKNTQNLALIGTQENTYDLKKRSIVILDTVTCANPFIGRRQGKSPVKLTGRMRRMILSFNPAHSGVMLRKAAKLRRSSYSEGVLRMKIEYNKASLDDPAPSNMVVTFEDEEEWYSLVYDTSWIAKAIIANCAKGGLLWGEHVRNVMPITVKDLNEEQLKLHKKIKKMIQECKQKNPS